MLMLIKLSSWMLGINSGDSIWFESEFNEFELNEFVSIDNKKVD